jgi:hypothetical protein
MDNTYYRTRFNGARRIAPTDSTAVEAVATDPVGSSD